MPRLSLYRPNRTHDYRFIDRRVYEMYTVGGIDIFVHKYLGPKGQAESNDATQPVYDKFDPVFVEDLLLLENRNRKYSDDVYVLRGVYNVQDIDFDLSQFGLFLNNDTLFITFHYNNMIDLLQRKLMAGDVLEIPNLKDFHPLDPTLPRGLPRYYVIQDAAYASEGFSQTWLPHLWRVKAVPLSSSQEYDDILKKPFEQDNQWDNGNFYPEGTVVVVDGNYYQSVQDVPAGTDISDTAFWVPYTPASIQETISTFTRNLEINDAILNQAEAEVPLSGYDTTKFYIVPTPDDQPPVVGELPDSPRGNGYTMGYLTGDGVPPNGMPVTPGTAFPLAPAVGDHCLRLDYFPNRLFRFDGARWIHIESSVRTDLTPGPNNQTLRSGFVNNEQTVQTSDRGEIPSRQSLSQALKPKADN